MIDENQEIKKSLVPSF